MTIRAIKEVRIFLYTNSGFQKTTVDNAIKALGFPLNGSQALASQLSSILLDCSKHGADIGISGFMYYKDTAAFFRENRKDIVRHMENAAEEMGTDVISMVQGFAVFRYGPKPAVSEVGKALWAKFRRAGLASLYNVFAWYVLEELAHTWRGHLEEAAASQLSA